MSPLFSPIRKLRADDPVESFDCNQRDLNRYLQRYAWKNQESNIAQTYVSLSGLAVAGYYSLCASSVSHMDAPEHVKEGLPKYPIPAVLLAKLAVDARFQKRGLGRSLLRSACIHTSIAAGIIGARVMVVHAKIEAIEWYSRFNFMCSPSSSNNGDKHRTMFLPLNEVQCRI